MALAQRGRQAERGPFLPKVASMLNKMMLPAIFLTLSMGFLQTSALGADELPPRALARLGDYRFYHGPGIECAVLSSDGSRVASAARYSDHNTQVSDQERQRYNCTIVVWDAATGERVRELRAPRGPLSHLAFSVDGKLLAADCGGYRTRHSLAVFEVASGKLLKHFGDFRFVGQLQFSADGKQLHVSEWLGPASAWDIATGKQLRVWKPPALQPAHKNKEGVCGVRGVLSPDGKVIVWEMGYTSDEGATSCDAAGLRVYDAVRDKLLYRKKVERSRRLNSFGFSLDGKRFAADCGKLTVWETATGKELISLDIEKMSRFALAPDGRHAAIYEEGSRVRLWDLDAGKAVRDLYSGSVAMRADNLEMPQVFSADGKTLLLDSYTALHLFDTRTGKERAAPGHRSPITPRFSADGRTLFTTCGETRRSWDVSGKQPTLLAEEQRKPWKWEARPLSADDRLFLERDWNRDRTRVRETATGRVVSVLDGMYPHDALFSPDASRMLFYASADKKPLKGGRYAVYWLCDVKTGKVLWEFEPKGLRNNPVFSPDGRLIAWTNQNGDITLYESATGKVRRTLHSTVPLPEGKGSPEGLPVLFSHDGTHLMMTFYLWDFDVGQQLEFRYTIMPIRVFHVSSGKEVKRFYADPQKAGKGGPLSCAAWSPDGRLLAVAEKESGMIRLLELASGKVRTEFAGHRHGVHGLAFAPDGKTLASGGEDTVVFLWDVVGSRTGAAVKNPSEKDLAGWWGDLAAEDAKRAGTAVASLAGSPEQSVPFLRDRLRPAEAVDEKRLGRLIADLDATALARREAAARQLALLGEQAEPRLRQALKEGPPLEVSRRIETLLERLERGPLPSETLRALRAIEVLEHLGTPETRRCLEALAKGTEARQTRDAKAALDRLARRR
jgi:WD40 repeat protein